MPVTVAWLIVGSSIDDRGAGVGPRLVEVEDVVAVVVAVDEVRVAALVVGQGDVAQRVVAQVGYGERVGDLGTRGDERLARLPSPG